jgi:N-acetyltransferase
VDSDFDIHYDRLVGQHVRLEPIHQAHVPGLFDAGQHAEDWVYLPIPGFASIRETEEWVGQAIHLAQLGQQYTYVLVDPVHQHIMGSTRFLNIRAKHGGLEIGYSWLGHQFQRTSVNTETKFLLLKQAFEVMNAIRVELKTDSRNLRSQLAIERIGATREGVLRNHMIAQNHYRRDSVIYSITDEEWPEIKASLKQRLLDYNATSS